ncbi:MNIO class RiPP chryseobasin precursor ChrA [Chryseobacterium viscerum]|jgi:hypothetical protein|uniref:Uncharacterized protein n=1 Tax=Chryseobacterium viscerum TaxID=1037377 RepID=A0A316WUH7_9FLAO|nr:hypothetical protein [Chryseobacterium viscerum]KAB1228756.1 hypothetical protein F8D52_21300 [Chryseobacterium viscerum]PWN62848.1 hypothetical protein C1634_008725 [Chryseobacterium viscerum]
MKIPTLLMASLLAVGVSAQTTKPANKEKKPAKKSKKTAITETPGKPKPGTSTVIVKKDSVIPRGHGCPACGMG